METFSQSGKVQGPHTWEEFLDLPDDDRRELIDGEFVEVEVPNPSHEFAVARLIYFVTGWSLEHDRGHVLASGYKVRISEKRGIMPDVQFFSKDNPIPRGQNRGLAMGRPDLAIEVISPSSRKYDRVTKLNWYASIGVPEYWLLDPEEQTLEQFVLAGEHYSVVSSLTDDAVFCPATFPGLEIPLAKIWPDERVRGLPTP